MVLNIISVFSTQQILVGFIVIGQLSCFCVSGFIIYHKSKYMSDNFKYDDYDDDFQMNNPSNIQSENKAQQKQHEPETIRMLGKQQKKETEAQIKSTTDTSTKSKLIDQHVKLKSQLKQLASKMDEILEKQRERKKKKLQGQPQDEDERVIELKKKLKDDEQKMQKIKNDIMRLRRNMDSKYDINKIVDKENQLKHLVKQLQTLEEQKQALQKIRKTQDKAIRNQDDKQSKNKKARMQEQLKQIQAQTKKQQDTINQKQKQIRKLHESYITKAERVKQIEMKLNEKKKSNSQDQATPEQIAKLQEQLKQIEAEKAAIEKEGNQRMRALEKQKKQLKVEMERKKLILEEKEKQLRLNQMKHKEIIRLINSSQQQQAINQSRLEKQNKSEAKRVVAKKGREVPNMQIDGQQEPLNEQKTKEQSKQESKSVEVVSKPQKHQYGFSANLDQEVIIDD